MKRVWKCEFEYCSQYHEKKADAIEHEKECSCNPANQRCISCRHFDCDDDSYYTSGRGWYCKIDEPINTGFCKMWEGT